MKVTLTTTDATGNDEIVTYAEQTMTDLGEFLKHPFFKEALIEKEESKKVFTFVRQDMETKACYVHSFKIDYKEYINKWTNGGYWLVINSTRNFFVVSGEGQNFWDLSE